MAQPVWSGWWLSALRCGYQFVDISSILMALIYWLFQRELVKTERWVSSHGFLPCLCFHPLCFFLFLLPSSSSSSSFILFHFVLPILPHLSPRITPALLHSSSIPSTHPYPNVQCFTKVSPYLAPSYAFATLMVDSLADNLSFLPYNFHLTTLSLQRFHKTPIRLGSSSLSFLFTFPFSLAHSLCTNTTYIALKSVLCLPNYACGEGSSRLKQASVIWWNPY